MKEAYLLLRSNDVFEGELVASTSTAEVIRLDRVAGPYGAILRARGSVSDIEQLASRVGISVRDVCWLNENRF